MSKNATLIVTFTDKSSKTYRVTSPTKTAERRAFASAFVAARPYVRTPAKWQLKLDDGSAFYQNWLPAASSEPAPAPKPAPKAKAPVRKATVPTPAPEADIDLIDAISTDDLAAWAIAHGYIAPVKPEHKAAKADNKSTKAPRAEQKAARAKQAENGRKSYWQVRHEHMMGDAAYVAEYDRQMAANAGHVKASIRAYNAATTALLAEAPVATRKSRKAARKAA
jgi:hypothetical protein